MSVWSICCCICHFHLIPIWPQMLKRMQNWQKHLCSCVTIFLEQKKCFKTIIIVLENGFALYNWVYKYVALVQKNSLNFIYIMFYIVTCPTRMFRFRPTCFKQDKIINEWTKKCFSFQQHFSTTFNETRKANGIHCAVAVIRYCFGIQNVSHKYEPNKHTCIL